MVNQLEYVGIFGNTFNVPFFNAISNTNNQSIQYGFEKSGINSLFS